MAGPQLSTYQEEQERRRCQNLVPCPRRSRGNGTRRRSVTCVTTGGRSVSGVSCPRPGAQLGQTRPGALEEERQQGRSCRGLGRRRRAGRVLSARPLTLALSLQPQPSGHFSQPQSGRKEELPQPSGDTTLPKAATMHRSTHGCLRPT